MPTIKFYGIVIPITNVPGAFQQGRGYFMLPGLPQTYGVQPPTASEAFKVY